MKKLLSLFIAFIFVFSISAADKPDEPKNTDGISIHVDKTMEQANSVDHYVIVKQEVAERSGRSEVMEFYNLNVVNSVTTELLLVTNENIETESFALRTPYAIRVNSTESYRNIYCLSLEGLPLKYSFLMS